MRWEPCRVCGEMMSVDCATKLLICEACMPAYAAERHHLWIEDLLSRPLDIDRWADEAEDADLDIERMLGYKVRKPIEFMGGDPAYTAYQGGLPSLGKGYS